MNYLLTLFLVFLSCSLDDDQEISGTWSIDKEEIVDGGPGKDGIPSVDQPQYSNSLDQLSFMSASDPIIGVVHNGEAFAYPVSVLDWHEVINSDGFAVTYCPLTGTAVVDDTPARTFGVSGLLYRNNLIMYDRQTDSKWSQLLFKSVNGSQIEQTVSRKQAIHTTASTWLSLYPNSKWMNGLNTAYNTSRYTTSPYGTYDTNTRILFPIKHSNGILHLKAQIYGLILADSALAISYEKFNDQHLFEFERMEKSIVVIGSADNEYIVSFNRSLDGSTLNFELSKATFPYEFKDLQTNSIWNIHGEAVSGAHLGKQLDILIGIRAYWFAWYDFYPETELIQ